MPQVPNHNDLENFFSRRPPVPPRREPAGEWLVKQGLLTREELLRALQIQDKVPGIRIGECVVALGFAGRKAVRDAIALRRAVLSLDAEQEADTDTAGGS